MDPVEPIADLTAGAKIHMEDLVLHVEPKEHE
jgi:hypothetical protein